MKKLLIALVLIFNTSIIFSQKTHLPKIEKSGDLTEVTVYYDSGNIMQHGYYSKKGDLQGSWVSYYEDGSKKCVAFYNYGVKNGTWIYWKDGETTSITYNNNRVMKVEKSNQKELNKDDDTKIN